MEVQGQLVCLSVWTCKYSENRLTHKLVTDGGTDTCVGEASSESCVIFCSQNVVCGEIFVNINHLQTMKIM